MTTIYTVEISNYSGVCTSFMFSTEQKALDWVKENLHKDGDYGGIWARLEYHSLDDPTAPQPDGKLLVEAWKPLTGEVTKWYY